MKTTYTLEQFRTTRKLNGRSVRITDGRGFHMIQVLIGREWVSVTTTESHDRAPKLANMLLNSTKPIVGVYTVYSMRKHIGGKILGKVNASSKSEALKFARKQFPIRHGGRLEVHCFGIVK